MTPDTGIESAARSSVTNYHLNSSNDNFKESPNSNRVRHNQLATENVNKETHNIPINDKKVNNNNCIAVGLSNAVNLAVQDAVSNAITNYLSSSPPSSSSSSSPTSGTTTMTSQIFNHNNLNSNNKRKQTQMLPIQMINSSTQNSVNNNTFSSSSDDSSNLIINNNQHQYVPLTVSKVPKNSIGCLRNRFS